MGKVFSCAQKFLKKIKTYLKIPNMVRQCHERQNECGNFFFNSQNLINLKKILKIIENFQKWLESAKNSKISWRFLLNF